MQVLCLFFFKTMVDPWIVSAAEKPKHLTMQPVFFSSTGMRTQKLFSQNHGHKGETKKAGLADVGLGRQQLVIVLEIK